MHIVFFDGVCGLCNSVVDSIIVRDKKGLYRYTPLQGETAKKELSQVSIASLESIVLKSDGRLYFRSEAVLKVLIGLGGVWNVMRVFFLIPAFLRDIVYNFIAKNRYKWFGKRETCRMPTLAEKKLFLP